MKRELLFVAVLVSAVAHLTGTRATAAPPALTPGQNIQVREGDDWSDATFEKQEGRKYQVRFTDGSEQWVTADRVRVNAGAAPLSAGTGPVNPSTLALDGPITEIDLHQNRTVPKRASQSLYIKPATRPTSDFTDLTPPTDLPVGHVSRLLECPDTPGLVVGVGDPQHDQTPLLCIHTDKPSATELRIFTAHEHTVLAVGDGGRWLLTKPNTWGTFLTHLWEYDGGTYQLRANWTMVVDRQNRQVDWARFLTPTRLLVHTDNGSYLFDIKTKEQLGFVKCGDIKVHCSQQVLLTTVDFAPAVLRMSDLAIVAQLDGGSNLYSMDPTGNYMVVGNDQAVSVVKIGTKKPLYGMFGIPTFWRFDLMNPTDLVLDGGLLYDTKTAIPVWNYKHDGPTLVMPSGQMLYVTTIDDKTAILLASVPDSLAADALKTASPDQFTISPGAHIAIEGDFSQFVNASEARKALESVIINSGDVPDDTATHYKMSVTCKPGPTGKIDIHEFHMETGPINRQVDSPSTIATVILRHNGFTIWKREVGFGNEAMIQVPQGQTVEQAAAEASKPKASKLYQLSLPPYIVRSSKASTSGTLGESNLKRGGFLPVVPPPTPPSDSTTPRA